MSVTHNTLGNLGDALQLLLGCMRTISGATVCMNWGPWLVNVAFSLAAGIFVTSLLARLFTRR